MTGFAHLLAPGAIGTLALRNRILMAPMGDSLANPDGTVSDAQLAYFEARARGGAALLLIGSVAVAYPDGCVDERQVGASLDAHEPGLRARPSLRSSRTTVRSPASTSHAVARCSCPRSRRVPVPIACR